MYLLNSKQFTTYKVSLNHLIITQASVIMEPPVRHPKAFVPPPRAGWMGGTEEGRQSGAEKETGNLKLAYEPSK